MPVIWSLSFRNGRPATNQHFCFDKKLKLASAYRNLFSSNSYIIKLKTSNLRSYFLKLFIPCCQILASAVEVELYKSGRGSYLLPELAASWRVTLFTKYIGASNHSRIHSSIDSIHITQRHNKGRLTGIRPGSERGRRTKHWRLQPSED